MAVRPQIEGLIESCYGCTACAAVCPENAIVMEQGESYFRYPIVDRVRCTLCGRCELVCPALSAGLVEPRSPQCHYGRHLEAGVEKSSSSGGAFRALADAILRTGGVVYGAAYDPVTKTVRHRNTRSVSLDALMGSKYVQSDADGTFREVGELLAGGTPVLYCGTPCQIAGLKSYLDSGTVGLVTVDFVCHGVGPMAILREHLDHLEMRYGSTVANVNFRPKSVGWQPHAIRVSFVNGRTYEAPAVADEYFRGFIVENIFLRRSCYDCRFSIEHLSDITLADFWGFRALGVPGLDDNRGISLLLVNTDVGVRCLSEARVDFAAHDCPWDAARYVLSPRVTNSATLAARSRFMDRTNEVGFEAAARETYLHNRTTARLKYSARKLATLCRGYF